MCAHRLPSVPAWTALATRAQSESSEDTTSSYDMQDELAEATAQSSPQTGHKRKEDERRRQSNGPHKKRRLDERINVFNENADDIPASAHAAPVRRALPSRPRPPVPPFTKAPNVAAARRAFEETHGPVPSTSASQHASSPNPRGEGIATQRPVARKSAAIPPPGRRKNHGPPNSGPSRSPVPPPATAPSRMTGNRRSSLSTIDRPEKEQSTVRKRPRAIPRNRSRRRTIAEPIAYIEISDSDEEVPMRPPRSSLRNSRQRARKEIDVIELTDSDEPGVPTSGSLTQHASVSDPIIIGSSDSEADAGPPRVTHSEDEIMHPQDAPHSPEQDDFDVADIAMPLPFQQESPSISLDHELGFQTMQKYYSPTASVPADPVPLSESSESPAAEPPTTGTPQRTVDNAGFGSDFLRCHQDYHVHSSDPSTSFHQDSPSAGRLSVADDIQARLTHFRQVTPEENILQLADKGNAHAELQVIASRSSGEVETLVPALDDMALVSSSTSATSDSPLPQNDTNASVAQTIGIEEIDGWSARDGSGVNTSVNRSPSVDEQVEHEVYMEGTSQKAVALANPATPFPQLTVPDLNLSAITSSRKKRSSRSSMKFSYTPIMLSPVSPPFSSGSAPVCSSRATESPLSPSLGRKQRIGIVLPEVRGHLYGDEGGFFKAVFKNKSKSPTAVRKAQSSQADSPDSHTSTSVSPNPATRLGASPRLPSPPGYSVEAELLPSVYPAFEIEQPERTSVSRPQSPLTSAEHFDNHSIQAPSLQVPSLSRTEAANNSTGTASVAMTSIGRPKKPALPIPRVNRVLINTIAQVQLKHATQQGQLIDLTMDDSEPEDGFPTEPLANPPIPSYEPEENNPEPKEDIYMASRSASPTIPTASVFASLVEPERESEGVSMQIHPSFTEMHETYQEDTMDNDEESVRGILLDSGRSSPNPLDTLPTQGRRRSARIIRRVTTRSNSNSSGFASRPDSPAFTPSIRPEAHVVSLRMDTGVTRALVRRMREVSVTSSEEDDGMSWVTYGKVLMREYANVRLRARDLPHRMQDYLNTLPPFVNRAQDYKRTIFKAMIRSNTAEIEPCAPEIDIINSVDDEQCPPLEFYYTNYMWHSDSVPTLDASKLKGCGCYPVCLPDSKCSCLKRQQDFYDETMSGFNYSQGRLKYEEYPIFECNALCGCDEDCRNRVVQHGRKHAINIEKTKEKGWGVFAAEHIPAKTFVGIYSGEFITDVEGETRGKIYHLGSRTYLFDIDFWHLKKGKEDWEVKYCVDAFHAGNFTRYLNHSCEPNCLLVPVYINEPDLEKPMLAIFTSKDVYVHQELCFSYFGPPDGEQEEDALPQMQDDIFISCKCGSRRCTGRIWK